MPFELPSLKFAFDALEPYIDAQTVEVHYTKHHTTYMKNLNAALEKHPELFDFSIESLLSDLDKIPEDIRTAVRNNGGGYYNHNIYWAGMAPNAKIAKGKLADALEQRYGSLNTFKQEMEKAAMGHFGSGYAWLSKQKDGSLVIHDTSNQDCPLTSGLLPIMVVDVWEHAYYLKYQNRRVDYLSNWWNVVDWEEASRRFEIKI